MAISTNHHNSRLRIHQMKLRKYGISDSLMAKVKSKRKPRKSGKKQTAQIWINKAPSPLRNSCEKTVDKEKENLPSEVEFRETKQLLSDYREIVCNNLHCFDDETKLKFNKLEQVFAKLHFDQPSNCVTQLPLAVVNSVELEQVIPSQALESSDNKTSKSSPSSRLESKQIVASESNMSEDQQSTSVDSRSQSPVSTQNGKEVCPSLCNDLNSNLTRQKQKFSNNCCLGTKVVINSDNNVINKINSKITINQKKVNNMKYFEKSQETSKTMSHTITPIKPKYVLASQGSISINPEFYKTSPTTLSLKKNKNDCTEKTITHNKAQLSTIQESVTSKKAASPNMNIEPVINIDCDINTNVLSEKNGTNEHYLNQIATNSNRSLNQTDNINQITSKEVVNMNGNLDILATIACHNANCLNESIPARNLSLSSISVNGMQNPTIKTTIKEIESTNPVNLIGSNLVNKSLDCNRIQVAFTAPTIPDSYCINPSSVSSNKSYQILVPNLGVLGGNRFISQPSASISNQKTLKQCENCGNYWWSIYTPFYCILCIQLFSNNPDAKKLCSYGRDTLKVNRDLKLGLLVKITVRIGKQPAVDALKHAKNGDYQFYRCQECDCPGYVDSNPCRVGLHTLLQHYRGRGNSLSPMPFYCDLCSLVLADHSSLLKHLPECVASKRSKAATAPPRYL